MPQGNQAGLQQDDALTLFPIVKFSVSMKRIVLLPEVKDKESMLFVSQYNGQSKFKRNATNNENKFSVFGVGRNLLKATSQQPKHVRLHHDSARLPLENMSLMGGLLLTSLVMSRSSLHLITDN